ncbi:unnamed protein product, partial [Discosporangium mesarthrocarpum]
MTLRHYRRHLKPTGAAAEVTLTPADLVPGGDGGGGFALPGPALAVLAVARPLGPGLQLQCPGFLPNARQHRMFGLAVLEVAQLVRHHWDSL